MRSDGGRRRSRVSGVASRVRSGAGRAASGAREVGGQAAADARRAARALDQNELGGGTQAARRRGIPELTSREARERDMADNAVQAATMGAPVQATLEPVTRPEEMQFFVTGMGRPEPADPAAGMGVYGLLTPGEPAEERGSAPLEFDDSLGVAVGMGAGSESEQSDRDRGELEFDEFLGGD